MFNSANKAAYLRAFLFFGLAVNAFSQAVVPDCVIPFSFTAAGSQPAITGGSNGFDNRFLGCDTWTLLYNVSGFSGLTLTFQSATGATGPGSFGTYSGTVVTGSNPNTSTTGAITQFANKTVITPWLTVNLSGLTSTGTVNGVVYGYKTGNTGGNGGGGGASCPNPCPVLGSVAAGAAVPNPVTIGLEDGAGNNAFLATASRENDSATGAQIGAVAPSFYNGVAYQRGLGCNGTSPIIINDSTMGNIQVIAASALTLIHICKMTLTAASTVSIQLTQGGAPNCSATLTNLSGLYQNALTVAEDFVADQSTLNASAGNAVCLNLSAGVQVTGMIWYAQY